MNEDELAEDSPAVDGNGAAVVEAVATADTMVTQEPDAHE